MALENENLIDETLQNQEEVTDVTENAESTDVTTEPTDEPTTEPETGEVTEGEGTEEGSTETTEGDNENNTEGGEGSESTGEGETTPTVPENDGNEVIVIEPEPVEPDPCTYLMRGVGIVDYDFRLDPEMYNVGYTLEDYNEGKWVLLTEEHKAFREAHPECSYKEMFDLEMTPVYEPTEEELANRARSNKLNQISQYDVSTNVNSFILNGEVVWLDKSMRVGLMNSMTIEKDAGREYSTLWFNNKSYTIPVDLGIQMLQALELYALACYNMTAEHKVNVQALETKEEIEAYDHTVGYPDKLIFDTTGGEAISIAE